MLKEINFLGNFRNNLEIYRKRNKRRIFSSTKKKKKKIKFKNLEINPNSNITQEIFYKRLIKKMIKIYAKILKCTKQDFF